MDCFSQSELEKAGACKQLTKEQKNNNQGIRFRYVTAEMLEKYRKMSEEEEMYKRQYEEAAFKVYGTLPSGKMTTKLKMQSKKNEVHKD